MTYLERAARFFRPQLPSVRYVPVQAVELPWLYVEIREVTWPRVPVLLVSGGMVRSGELPPPRWVQVAHVVDGTGRHNQFYYATQPAASVLRLAAWWDGHRWCLEEWLLRSELLIEPYEGCYFHEMRFSWRALVCRLIGHRVQSDPARSFSFRMKGCTRCHRITR